MDANSKLKLATDAIRFVANNHDGDEKLVREQLGQLRDFIAACEKAIPAERAAHAARLKAEAERKAALRSAA